MPDPTQITAGVGGLVALVAGLGYLVGKARKAARALDAIEQLVSRELEHNHGSSMKDDVHGLAVALGQLGRHVDDLDTAFQAHLNQPRRKWLA